MGKYFFFKEQDCFYKETFPLGRLSDYLRRLFAHQIDTCGINGCNYIILEGWEGSFKWRHYSLTGMFLSAMIFPLPHFATKLWVILAKLITMPTERKTFEWVGVSFFSTNYLRKKIVGTWLEFCSWFSNLQLMNRSEVRSLLTVVIYIYKFVCR